MSKKNKLEVHYKPFELLFSDTEFKYHASKMDSLIKF